MGDPYFPIDVTSARAAASARLRTPSLPRTLLTWCSAVFGEMYNRSPIWALVSPCRTRSSTSASRAVKGMGDVAALEDSTEGWIAALHLAALSMQGRDNVTE